MLRIIARLCLRPNKKSLQNEADSSIFTSKFAFVLVTKSAQQKPKTWQILKSYASKRACPTAIRPTDLVLMRLGRHYMHSVYILFDLVL